MKSTVLGLGFHRRNGDEMTHDELLAKIDESVVGIPADYGQFDLVNALRSVVELHEPISDNSCSDPDCCGGPYPDLCEVCSEHYPCPTIEAIEKELS